MGDRLLDWADLENRCGWETLVLGNGLSINIWGDFAYSNLFKQASLNHSACQLFSEFKTQNFETVLEALWHAERALTALQQDADEVTNLYEHVQSALFQAVQKVHVPWKNIDRPALTRISEAMSLHRLVFTLNYDLLTYWSAMESGPDSAIRDFFWASQNTFDINNATLEEGKTGLLYLHGGLHLWQDSQSGRTGKWTNRSGGALLKNLEANFKSIPSRQPLLVSEGTSSQKLARIRRSDYLTFALRTLSENTSDTVIFGVNFGDQDKHVFGAIAAGRRRRIAISIHPRTHALNDAAIANCRSRFSEHELFFFDSTSHPLGDRSLTVPLEVPAPAAKTWSVDDWGRDDDAEFDYYVAEYGRMEFEAPERGGKFSDEQRAAALEKAAAARRGRGELKDRLEGGGNNLKQVLKDAETNEVLGKMKVSELLEGLPKVGKVKAQEIITELEIAPTRRLRGLGDRQRKALLEKFDFTSDPEQISAPPRSLVARVRVDGSLRESFVAGRVHKVDFKIAAKGGVGEIEATAPIRSPTPGKSTTLDVEVFVDGSRLPGQTTQLVYPADGDGPWCVPVKVRAPRKRSNWTLYVTVRWKGRVIQSATLAGPVIDDESDALAPKMIFTVDVSSGVSTGASHGVADATFVTTPGRGAHPVIFDTTIGRRIESDGLGRALEGVRRVLIEILENPPASLEKAAVPMAKLALRGALLRDELLGEDPRQFDTAEWIHVTSFDSAQVPFQLVYDHPEPDPEDAAIRICQPALRGARSCVADCPDRNRSDRVCPLAFWGTSKIVERRQHSDGRHETTDSENRTVNVRMGGVVAVAPQANLADANASTRISEAVAQFVGQSDVWAEGWTGLATALATPRGLLCLVTHTLPVKPTDDLGPKLQLGDEKYRIYKVTRQHVNPDHREPGPVVLALGCDTATVQASFASFVSRLHMLGAEIVVTAIAQIPGRKIADFVERLMNHLGEQLAAGDGRFGAALTAARRETLCQGDVLALALTATGDADVRISTTARDALTARHYRVDKV